jgi:hypothetical protein
MAMQKLGIDSHFRKIYMLHYNDNNCSTSWCGIYSFRWLFIRWFGSPSIKYLRYNWWWRSNSGEFAYLYIPSNFGDGIGNSWDIKEEIKKDKEESNNAISRNIAGFITSIIIICSNSKEQ